MKKELNGRVLITGLMIVSLVIAISPRVFAEDVTCRYDSWGRLKQIENENGVKTEFLYSKAGDKMMEVTHLPPDLLATGTVAVDFKNMPGKCPDSKPEALTSNNDGAAKTPFLKPMKNGDLSRVPE